MPQRLDEFNKKFIYTDTNPENIIEGKAGAMFFRRGDEFFFNNDGNLANGWIKLLQRTVIIPPPPLTKLIRFKTPYELWLKTTDGYYNEFEELMPKTGWKFVSTSDIFAESTFGKTLNWLFPVPASSNDPSGINNSRSYDENYFYAKVGGKWYRTPIITFVGTGGSTSDNPYWETNLPFVDPPRYIPIPSDSNYPGITGDQSYDADFFYINASKWKRCPLLVFSPLSKMAEF